MSYDSASRRSIHSDQNDQAGRFGELELPDIGSLSLSNIIRPKIRHVIRLAWVGRWGYHATRVFCPYCSQNHIHPRTRVRHYSSPPTYNAPCRANNFAENSNEDRDEGEEDDEAGDGGDIRYQYRLVYPTNGYIEISSKKDENPYWVYPPWDQLAKNGQEIPHEVDELPCLNVDRTTLRSDKHKAVLETYAGMIREWDLTGKFKTIGLLLRGPGVKPTSTESGWKICTNIHEGCNKLDKKVYTQRSLRRCKAEGFSLPRSGWDQGISGQFNACLASMQLMTWYLEHHVILEDDHLNRALLELKEIAPPWRIPVDILVSRGSKDVCSDYARHLGSRYNVKFNEQGP